MSAWRMLLAKAWRESRARFWISVAVVAGLCLVFTLLQGGTRRIIAENVGRAPDYAAYIHGRIYGGVLRAIFAILVVVLGLGGLARERALGTLGLTLALPASRGAHVGARAAMGILQVVALAVLPALLVPLGSALGGASYPAAQAWLFALRWAAGGSLVFAIAFLASVLVRSDYLALLVAFVVLRVLPLVTPRWPLELDRLLGGAASSELPWGALAGSLAASALFVWIAARASARERFVS